MGLILSIEESVNNIPPLEDGTYTGVLVGIVEMGDQLDFDKKRYKNTIQFTFEVYGEFVDRGSGDEPRWAYLELTRSLYKNSNLRAALDALRGKEFSDEELQSCDLTKFIGRACTIEIKSSANGFANIKKTSKLMKGINPGTPVSQTFLFDLDAPERDKNIESLSGWVRKKIEASPTWAKLHAGSVEMSMDGDVPAPANPPQIPSNIDPETGEILKNTQNDEPAF